MSDKITNKADLRKWRTEIPNLYDDAGLDPYAFRLLVHYARVGDCWESVRTTAAICKMSVGQVVKSREELIAAGFIASEKNQRGGYNIDVVDRWAENFATFSEKRESKRAAERQDGEPVHSANSVFTERTACSCDEQECSCGEPKKELSKKTDAYASGAAEQGADAPAPTRKGASRARFTCTDAQADELVGHFSGVSLIERPMCVTSGQFAYFNKQWKTPVKTLYDTVGNMEHTKQLITHTVRLMQQKGLTITDPNSILKMANAERRKIRRAGGFVDSANGVYKGAG
jgi:hypothetical protein